MYKHTKFGGSRGWTRPPWEGAFVVVTTLHKHKSYPGSGPADFHSTTRTPEWNIRTIIVHISADAWPGEAQKRHFFTRASEYYQPVSVCVCARKNSSTTLQDTAPPRSSSIFGQTSLRPDKAPPERAKIKMLVLFPRIKQAACVHKCDA